MELKTKHFLARYLSAFNNNREALTGLGDRFGESLIDGNRVLDDLNPKMPRVRNDIGQVAALADVYADASPDLFEGLDHAVTTARTLTAQSGDIDAALLAALGFADDAAGTFERAGPYLVRGAAGPDPDVEAARRLSRHDSVHHPQLPHVGPGIASPSAATTATRWRRPSLGAGNPYIYPDNLPRVNARGGPEGRPGCWQKVTRDLWPMPYLVTDTGYSIAPTTTSGSDSRC